ncbi:ATP-binding protein [Spirosoma rhododendri]|uniref:ATP-binding protein n=1 Tax=Spirosoma rhododendri TaxID=2728024 RepID=UPI0020C28EC4|nr:ATP-binding protein [Spirosoma rhododendri]
MLNLLSNAFKFTLQGSIRVSLVAEGEQAVLAVTDTGVGIPAAELPHMFERFHRVENAGGRSFEGSGIGLSLVQELVQLHGGTISVSSVEKVGSTFTVQIPLGRAHLPAAQVSDDLADGPLSALADSFLQEASSILDETAPTATGNVGDAALPKADGYVLVVDDNADMRAYLTRLLSPYFTVHTAVHGADALNQLRTLTPQLILSDVMMPVMDGKELIRQLRQNPATALIPLIFLSARAGQEARIDGLEAGADDYLVKPFSAAELLTKVRAQISLEALRRSSAQAVAASETRYRQLAEELDEQVRQRTAELETMVVRLQRSNEYLQQFAYVASHDIQEPLRKIQQFSDLLQGRLMGVAGEKEVGFLSRIQVAAARISTLIRALLTYSQLDNAEPDRLPVALSEAVATACDALEISLTEADARLDMDPLPTVWGHFIQLSQLFQNLLGNALKFRHPGQSAHIQIRCTEVPANMISPSERPPQPVDSYYRVDVIDNGIGFDEKYQSRIFQVFQRLHTKGEYEGTGIGLAICQRIAINHGGFITAHSQPGQGATFSVYLPAQQPVLPPS